MTKAEKIHTAIAIVGWSAFFISMAGYYHFGKKVIAKDISTDEKKRTAGLTASAYIGGAGTATLIVYGLMRMKKNKTI